MNDFAKLGDIDLTQSDNTDGNKKIEAQPIPIELIDRSRVQDALIFISEQEIDLYTKVSLLIGYGRSLNRIFSTTEIEFALTEHEPNDGEKK